MPRYLQERSNRSAAVHGVLGTHRMGLDQHVGDRGAGGFRSCSPGPVDVGIHRDRLGWVVPVPGRPSLSPLQPGRTSVTGFTSTRTPACPQPRHGPRRTGRPVPVPCPRPRGTVRGRIRRGDEPVGQPQRGVGVDLVVHCAVDEQQLACQPVRDVHVGGTGPGHIREDGLRTACFRPAVRRQCEEPHVVSARLRRCRRQGKPRPAGRWATLVDAQRARPDASGGRTGRAAIRFGRCNPEPALCR